MYEVFTGGESIISIFILHQFQLDPNPIFLKHFLHLSTLLHANKREASITANFQMTNKSCNLTNKSCNLIGQEDFL